MIIIILLLVLSIFKQNCITVDDTKRYKNAYVDEIILLSFPENENKDL